MKAPSKRDIRERLEILRTRTGPALPLPVVLVYAHVLAFRLVLLFGMHLSFEEFVIVWLVPAAGGVSLVGLAKTANVLFLAYLGISFLVFPRGDNTRRRAHWVAHVGGIMVVLLLQVVFARAGDLAWHTYHCIHASRGGHGPEHAIDHYSRAIDLYPHAPMSYSAYHARADAYGLLGRYDRAIEDYTTAIRLALEYERSFDSRGELLRDSAPLAYCGRSIAYWRTGDRENAEADYRRVAKLLGFGDQADAVLHLHGPQVLRLLCFTASDRSDEESRRAAVEILGRIGDSEAVPHLVRALRADLYTTAGRAAWALGRVGDSTALPALLDVAMGSRNDWVRERAIWALGAIGDGRAVEPLLMILRSDPSDKARGHAAVALADIGDEVAVPGLLDALENSGRHAWHGASLALYKFSQADAFLPVSISYGVLIPGLREDEVRRWARGFVKTHPEVVARYEEIVAAGREDDRW